MRSALDEGVPEPLAQYLPGHEIKSVRELGLKGVKNGRLLATIETLAFEAFITNDKRMEAEGQLLRRNFGILILSATNWPFILPNVQKIAEALNHCRSGEVIKVDCGHFVPRRLRKP